MSLLDDPMNPNAGDDLDAWRESRLAAIALIQANRRRVIAEVQADGSTVEFRNPDEPDVLAAADDMRMIFDGCPDVEGLVAVLAHIAASHIEWLAFQSGTDMDGYMDELRQQVFDLAAVIETGSAEPWRR